MSRPHMLHSRKGKVAVLRARYRHITVFCCIDSFRVAKFQAELSSRLFDECFSCKPAFFTIFLNATFWTSCTEKMAAGRLFKYAMFIALNCYFIISVEGSW